MMTTPAPSSTTNLEDLLQTFLHDEPGTLRSNDLDIMNWRTTDHSLEDQQQAANLVNEELAELIQANIKLFCRHKPAALEKVAEETADVILMLDQLVRLVPKELILKYLHEKTDRTIARYHCHDSDYDDTAQF